jgi:CBS domain-containing protein
MKARDVMVSPVITVKPSSSVKEVAKTFLERRISAAPVVDDQGKLVGIVSEGDLMHRAEAGNGTTSFLVAPSIDRGGDARR